MAYSKTAILCTKSWTEIGKVTFNRREWPQVIHDLRSGRLFAKATTGHEQEKYVEQRVLHTGHVKRKADYVKAKLRAASN